MLNSWYVVKSPEVTEVKPMNHKVVISKNLLCTHQKDSSQTRSSQTKTRNEALGYIVRR